MVSDSSVLRERKLTIASITGFSEGSKNKEFVYIYISLYLQISGDINITFQNIFPNINLLHGKQIFFQLHQLPATKSFLFLKYSFLGKLDISPFSTLFLLDFTDSIYIFFVFSYLNVDFFLGSREFSFYLSLHSPSLFSILSITCFSSFYCESILPLFHKNPFISF